MKIKLFAAVLFASLLLLPAGAAQADEPDVDSAEVPAPHTPTLIFYLAGFDTQPDVDAIRASVGKLKSAVIVAVNTNRSYARIRFDSHIVSYHQVAQAIAGAGKTLGKNYDPCLVFYVREYAQSNNAAKVDAIFSGKRLNTRVVVRPLDKSKGEFTVHFRPLKIDPNVTAPQGFNGGHLHHPISDPPPRGLGLTSGYASEYAPISF